MRYNPKDDLDGKTSQCFFTSCMIALFWCSVMSVPWSIVQCQGLRFVSIRAGSTSFRPRKYCSVTLGFLVSNLYCPLVLPVPW